MKKIFMFINVDWFFLSHRLPIVKNAKKNNVKINVFAEFTKNHNKFNYDFDFFDSPLKRKSKNYLNLLFEVFNTFKIVKNNEPNLIHAVTIKPIIVLGIITKITKIPFIASVSGLGPAFSSNSKFKKIRLWILTKVLKLIFSRDNVGIICQNDHDKNELLKYEIITTEKIIIIPGSGVDLEIYSPSKNKFHSEDYILMSSRMLFDKGIREYCLASNIVKKSYKKKIKFVLSGPLDIPSPSSISQKELKSLINQNHIDYIGHSDNMAELIASAKIFIYPSYYPEGIPKVLIEANACGVPIITTDHPGCRDAIINNSTGLLIPIKDPVSLSDAIIKLLKNKKLSVSMGKNARSLAESTYDVSKVIDKHYFFYQKFL